jgi:brefeldin A-inhibited guanine nucleotide-exchange protein
LLLRFLCNISTRQGQTSTDANRDAKAKSLALDMLLMMVTNAPANFFANERVLLLVRTSLMSSLLHNITFQHLSVFRLCVQIFAVLTHRLRAHLKTPIQVFFDNIFLRTLQSPNSSAEQKLCVLSVVRDMLTEPQLIIDFFVNYDCEMESVDLLERLVNIISKECLSNHVNDYGFTPAQDLKAKFTSLEALGNVLSSLCKWVDPRLTKAEGVGKKEEISEDASELQTASSSQGDVSGETAEDRAHAGKEKKLSRAKAIARFNIGM